MSFLIDTQTEQQLRHRGELAADMILADRLLELGE